ncbi:MAG: hypothetical protein Q9160_001945 [Pyrenula sp. 1 TL-2023]
MFLQFAGINGAPSRYLQERGYGQAAVILQRDWNRGDPQSLSFAHHIKDHALVSLVQQGLQYYHLKQTPAGPNGEMLPLDPSKYFFGPESARPVQQSTPKGEAGDEAGTGHLDPSSRPGGRKHARESGPNGLPLELAVGQPAPKRSRKSATNGERLTNGEQHDESKMQLDAPMINANNLHVNGNSMSNRIENNYGNVYSQLPQSTSDAGNADAGVAPGSAKSATPADAEMDAENDMGMHAGLGNGSGGMTQDQEQITAIVRPPRSHTLTNGHSVGVQITPQPAKIKDLRPQSRVLGVAHSHHVLRQAWRPRDPSVLAASGEQFVGIWKFPETDNGESPAYHSFLDEEELATVTASAWHPSGSTLAVATHSDQAGKLIIYDGETGAMSSNIAISRNMITNLRWSTVGSRIAASASDGKESSLILWDLSDPRSNFASITTQENILDLAWAVSGNSAILCASGENVIYQCRSVGAELIIERRLPSPEPDTWAFVKVPWYSEDSATIIAASSESANLWIPTHDLLHLKAHSEPISGMALAPSSSTSTFPSDHTSYTFATSSLDSTIKVWRFDPLPPEQHTQSNPLTLLHRFSMGISHPVLALSYSPLGTHLAAAHRDTVNVWRVGTHTSGMGTAPMARWEGKDEWKTGSNNGKEPQERERLLDRVENMSLDTAEPIVNGDAVTPTLETRQDNRNEEEELEHCLSWDTGGERLAFGVGGQVVVLQVGG